MPQLNKKIDRFKGIKIQRGKRGTALQDPTKADKSSTLRGRDPPEAVKLFGVFYVAVGP